MRMQPACRLVPELPGATCVFLYHIMQYIAMCRRVSGGSRIVGIHGLYIKQKVIKQRRGLLFKLHKIPPKRQLPPKLQFPPQLAAEIAISRPAGRGNCNSPGPRGDASRMFRDPQCLGIPNVQGSQCWAHGSDLWPPK